MEDEFAEELKDDRFVAMFREYKFVSRFLILIEYVDQSREEFVEPFLVEEYVDKNLTKKEFVEMLLVIEMSHTHATNLYRLLTKKLLVSL